MNQNENQLAEWAELDCDSVNFDELEKKLDSELEEQMSDLEGLENDREKIGNPDTIGETVMNVVWEQFINQVGVIAGEDFIKENRGLTLDLRDDAHIVTIENYGKEGVGSHNHIIKEEKFIKENHGQTLDLSDDAHIQTPGNFAEGKLATHNYYSKEQLEHNYDRYKNKPHGEFRKEHVNPGMNATLKRAGDLYNEGVETVTDIYTGRQIPTKTKLEDGSNNPMAAQREHVTPSAEAYKRPSLQMSSTDEQLGATINDPNNLQGYTTAERNNRKSDNSADEMEERDKNKHWEKANKKSEEFIREKEKEGEQRLEEEGRKTQKEEEERSISAGKQSQKEEAVRIGKTALRAVLMGLLASLIKDIIRKLIKWFRSGNRKLSTFIDSVKDAIMSFVSNLKEHLLSAGNTFITSIATAIFGPVIGMIKKAWIFLKQGYKSVKEAIEFLKNPVNRNLPFSIKMMNIGEIVIAGLTAGGAIALSEVIEKGLMSIPGFAFEIPLLGSLASIIGMFLGALVSGLIGALALNLIDRAISKKLKEINTVQRIDKGNNILELQSETTTIKYENLNRTREITVSNIRERHFQTASQIKEDFDSISENQRIIEKNINDSSICVAEYTETEENIDNKLMNIDKLLESNGE